MRLSTFKNTFNSITYDLIGSNLSYVVINEIYQMSLEDQFLVQFYGLCHSYV